jgi:hypothetical protein
MNTIVVLEDPATKRRQECAPYAFASALEVHCLCGNLIHPIPGAWCTLCGRKVVDIWQESTPTASTKGDSGSGLSSQQSKGGRQS